jgi:hypothetical protein
MGLRLRHGPLCWTGATSKTLIEYGETSVHTLRHCGIGDRPSVSSGSGPDLCRGASVRSVSRRADPGRYYFAGRCHAGSEGSGAVSHADGAAFRFVRPVFEICARRSAAAAGSLPTTAAAGSAAEAANQAAGQFETGGGRATTIAATAPGAIAVTAPGTGRPGARSFD